MVTIHNSKGSVDEQDIANLESVLGIIFPNDYRDFLKQYNGGYPDPDGFHFAESEDGSSVDKFLDVSFSRSDSIIECYGLYEHRIPDLFIPIAKDPGGNLILIDVRKGNNGVYFWDHEFESEDEESPNMTNVYLIDLNFKSFLNNLYEIKI